MLATNGVTVGIPWGDSWSCCRLVDPISVRLLLATVVDARDVFFNSSDETETNMASIWFVSSPADNLGIKLLACRTDFTKPGARCSTVLLTSWDLCMVPRNTYTKCSNFFRLASLSRVSSASKVWAPGGSREAKTSGRYIFPAASRLAIRSASLRNASNTEKRPQVELSDASV